MDRIIINRALCRFASVRPVWWRGVVGLGVGRGGEGKFKKNKQNLIHRERNVDEQMDATFQSVTAVCSASILSHGEEVIFCIVSKRLSVYPSRPQPAPQLFTNGP